MNKYSWRTPVAGCSAQAAGEMMEFLEKRDGEVTKEALLEASRPEDSPTHGAFEWDDSVAAEKYRLRQANFMINQLEVHIQSEDSAPVKERAYLNVVEGKNNPGRFRGVEIALSDAEMREVVLHNALAELVAFKNKYERLTELAEIFSAIDRLKGEME